jgi:hypothetical protein
MPSDPAEWTQAQFSVLSRWAIKADPDIPNMVTDVIFPAMMTSPLHTMADIHDRLGGQGRRGFIQTQHDVDGRPAQRTWRRKRSSRRAARRSRRHSAATRRFESSSM